MKGACIVFPHQLFRDHPFTKKGLPVYMVEEYLFFRQYRYHRAKLVLHRASMKWYEQWLKGSGVSVRYIDSSSQENYCRQLIAALAGEGVEEVFAADPGDDWLNRRLRNACRRYNITCTISRSTNWLNSVDEVQAFFRGKEWYFQTDFYVEQRKRRGLLLDEKGRPLGNKWSFDAENRKRFPRGGVAPLLPLPEDNEFVSEARKYVSAHFPDAYGPADGPCLFGVSFEEADKWLDIFIRTRLSHFGDYEDAMVNKEPFLFHSILTPMLNVGLLDPGLVVNRVLEAGKTGHISLNSLEGFIRQVVGWREFIHVIYEHAGRHQRTRNFWGFSRRIPAHFWKGETGIGPLDTVIKKVLHYGYCHHIERLMVLGNFMLLCEFDPDEVYRWFMELFIDAYDWVMVPNVYGMTQFADGGLMTTKPYISGSNYLLKMGDFPRGDWQRTWDGLFWRFMHVHRDFFVRNPRLGMLVQTFDKMPKEKREAHLAAADDFLAALDDKSDNMYEK